MLLMFLLPFALAQYPFLRDVPRGYQQTALGQLQSSMLQNNNCQELYDLVNAWADQNQQPVVDLTATFIYIGQTGKMFTECLSTVFQTASTQNIIMKPIRQPVAKPGQSIDDAKQNVDLQISELLKHGVFNNLNAQFTVVALMSQFDEFVKLLYSLNIDDRIRLHLVDGYFRGITRTMRVEEKPFAIMEVALRRLDVSMIRMIFRSMNQYEIARYCQVLQPLVLRDALLAPQILAQLWALSYESSQEASQLLTSLGTYMQGVAAEHRQLSYVVADFLLRYQDQTDDHQLEWMLVNIMQVFTSSIVNSDKFREFLNFIFKVVKLSKDQINVQFLYQNSPDYIKITCTSEGQNLVLDGYGWRQYMRTVATLSQNPKKVRSAALTLLAMRKSGNINDSDMSD